MIGLMKKDRKESRSLCYNYKP